MASCILPASLSPFLILCIINCLHFCQAPLRLLIKVQEAKHSVGGRRLWMLSLRQTILRRPRSCQMASMRKTAPPLKRLPAREKWAKEGAGRMISLRPMGGVRRGAAQTRQSLSKGEVGCLFWNYPALFDTDVFCDSRHPEILQQHMEAAKNG